MKNIILREFKLAYRMRSDFMMPLIFFVIVISLFPLAISNDPSMLRLIAPGAIWIAALLAILLGLDRLFKSDFEDGCLEQLILSDQPLILIVLAKVFSYWLITAIPLLGMTPFICIMYGIPASGMTGILGSIALGSPTLCLLGAIGSALTLGLRNSGILLTLLVLPLYVPVLIFGTSAVLAGLSHVGYAGELALLAAFLIAALTLAPFAIAAALRVNV